MKKFVCPVCGYVLEAETMPEGFVCPEGLERALVVTGSRNRSIEVSSPQITGANASLPKGAAQYVAIK